jgi:hypothetical protein
MAAKIGLQQQNSGLVAGFAVHICCFGANVSHIRCFEAKMVGYVNGAVARAPALRHTITTIL